MIPVHTHSFLAYNGACKLSFKHGDADTDTYKATDTHMQAHKLFSHLQTAKEPRTNKPE